MFVYLVLLCYSFMNLHLYVNGFIFIIEYFNIIGYQFVIKKSQITNSKKKLHISMESQIVKKKKNRPLAACRRRSRPRRPAACPPLRMGPPVAAGHGPAGGPPARRHAWARLLPPAAAVAMTRTDGRGEGGGEGRRTRRGGGGGKGSGSGSEGMIQSYI